MKVEVPEEASFGFDWLRWHRGQVGIVAIMTLISLINIRTAVPDSVLPLDLAPTAFLNHIFATWTGNDFGQRVSGTTTSYIPVAVLYAMLHALGFSILTTQRLWFSILLSVAGVGMFSLYSSWWGKRNDTQAFIAGLLYVLNPYVLLNLKGASVLLIPYAVLPTVCLQTIRLVRRPRLTSLVAVGVTGGVLMAGVNPPLFAIALFVVILAGITEVAQMKFSPRAMRGLGYTLASIAFFSLWWIGPFVASLTHGGGASYFTTDPLSTEASNSSFVEVLRLTGLWALPQGWQGIPYFPSQAFLLSKPVVVVTLLAPLGSLAWIASRWNELRAKALAIAIVVAVFMAVSIYPAIHPSVFGHVYQWLYDRVYSFRAFRSVYKWEEPLAFAYALALPNLIGSSPAPQGRIGYKSMNSFVQRLGQQLWRRVDVASFLTKRPQYASPLVILVLFTYVVPFTDGMVFPSTYRIGSIPAYWHEAISWLNAQPHDGSVLFLPVQGFSTYNWGSPEGDIATPFLHRPEITQEAGIAFPQSVQSLLNLFQTPNQTQNWGEILTELGVEYVVQQNDANWQYYNSPPPSEMKAFLSSITSLRHVKTFGKLDIYAVRGGSHSSIGVAKAQLSILSDVSGAMPSFVEPNVPDYLIKSASATLSNPLIKSVRSSSVWNNLISQYGPQNAVYYASPKAWVSNVPYSIGQWIQINFTRVRSINRLLIVGRSDGIDALPKVLRVSVGGYSVKVTMSAQGIAQVSMPTHRSRHLRVTILSSRRGGPDVGIARIKIFGSPSSTVRYPHLSTNGPSEVTMALSPVGAESLPHILPITARTSARAAWTISLNPNESDTTLAKFLKPVGVEKVSASSRWNNLAAYSPLWTIAGDTHFSWASNRPGGVGQWINFKFPANRWIGSIILTGRNNGIDAEASRILLSNGTQSLGTRKVEWGKNGNAKIYVGKRVSELRITILSTQSGRQGSNVGFGQISIPGVSVQRDFKMLRSGPSLVIHRETMAGPSEHYPTSVTFTSIQQADEFAAGGVALSGASSVALTAGQNDVSTGANPLRETLALTLTVGNPRTAVVTWLRARQDFNSGVFVARIPKGYNFVLLNESPDPLWKVAVAGKLLERTSSQPDLGTSWALRGHTGMLRVSRAGRSSRIWLLIWLAAASIVVVISVAIDIVRRRPKKTREI